MRRSSWWTQPARLVRRAWLTSHPFTALLPLTRCPVQIALG